MRERRRAIALIAAAVLGPPGLTPAVADDIESALAAVHTRSGSPPDLRRRDAALAFLLARPETAFPIVLARATADPEDLALLDLLGRYRRAEATELLRRAFANPRTRQVAASGLGLSSDPQARAALRQALGSPDIQEVVAAISGLGASQDPAACADIRPQLGATAAEVRWMVVEVGDRLRCFDRPTIEAIRLNDPDATVRELAAEKLR